MLSLVCFVTIIFVTMLFLIYCRISIGRCFIPSRRAKQTKVIVKADLPRSSYLPDDSQPTSDSEMKSLPEDDAQNASSSSASWVHMQVRQASASSSSHLAFNAIDTQPNVDGGRAGRLRSLGVKSQWKGLLFPIVEIERDKTSCYVPETISAAKLIE
ncbi:MAG TPA: hypothetical protein VHW70_05455 [Edaphobacter sp.]|jgi:hypothetical protein|nr:hypothetical protein [Edaphobacter sp.]